MVLRINCNTYKACSHIMDYNASFETSTAVVHPASIVISIIWPVATVIASIQHTRQFYCLVHLKIDNQLVLY